VKQLSVIIPAFDEELSISSTVHMVLEMLSRSGMQGEVIVVNDGSRDDTGRLAMEAGARVISHASNHGYGASLKTGIRNAAFDLIAITDADGTYPIERIPDLVNALEGANMAVGARVGENVHIPAIRRPAKWLLRKLATHITGRPIPDLNSGLRVFRKSLALRYLHLLPSGFSFTTTMTVASMCDDLDVRFVPIDYLPRTGSSKIRPGHFPNFLMLVLRLAVLFKPLKIFVPASMVCLVFGLVKLLLDIVIALKDTGLTVDLLRYPIISTTTVVFLIASLQILLVGMVAESLAQRQSCPPGSPPPGLE
jgi:glycosyltransferase involved in cell wall biosynthesis